MLCKNCGKELADSALMCPNCGAPAENWQKVMPAATNSPATESAPKESPAVAASEPRTAPATPAPATPPLRPPSFTYPIRPLLQVHSELPFRSPLRREDRSKNR